MPMVLIVGNGRKTFPTITKVLQVAKDKGFPQSQILLSQFSRLDWK